MPEPRVPGNDFERWLAGSRVPPDERDTESLVTGIAAAIGARELEAAVALLTVLALRDPRKAQAIHDMILAVGEGDERRATLLAALGG